jgi:hypothetical protein
VNPVETLSIEVTAFLTEGSELAVRNPAEQPALAEALVATGEARARGVQLMVRLDPTHGVYGWLSYTLASAERRDAAWIEWRPSDYDQRHVLTALGGWTSPSGLDLGARLRVASGFPRTAVLGAYYDSRRDLYQPVFGEHNAARLPVFVQADVRVAQRVELAGSELELSLEVQNATNRANVEEFLYSADYSTQGAIRGLPILPVVGVRWSL